MSKPALSMPVLFRSPILMCLCVSEKQYKKALKKCNSKATDALPWVGGVGQASARYFTDDKTGDVSAAIVCIDIDNLSSVPVIYGLLVHEATHVWREIRERIGESEPSAEFEAYAMQMISLKLFDAAHKAMKRRGK